MSYITDRIQFLRDGGDCIPLEKKRSESRLKTYESATDARSWGDDTEDRRQHILELINHSYRGMKLGKYIPVDVLIDILMKNLSSSEGLPQMLSQVDQGDGKNNEVAALKRRIQELEEQVKALTAERDRLRDELDKQQEQEGRKSVTSTRQPSVASRQPSESPSRVSDKDLSKKSSEIPSRASEDLSQQPSKIPSRVSEDLSKQPSKIPSRVSEDLSKQPSKIPSRVSEDLSKQPSKIPSRVSEGLSKQPSKIPSSFSVKDPSEQYFIVPPSRVSEDLGEQYSIIPISAVSEDLGERYSITPASGVSQDLSKQPSKIPSRVSEDISKQPSKIPSRVSEDLSKQPSKIPSSFSVKDPSEQYFIVPPSRVSEDLGEQYSIIPISAVSEDLGERYSITPSSGVSQDLSKQPSKIPSRVSDKQRADDVTPEKQASKKRVSVVDVSGLSDKELPVCGSSRFSKSSVSEAELKESLIESYGLEPEDTAKPAPKHYVGKKCMGKKQKLAATVPGPSTSSMPAAGYVETILETGELAEEPEKEDTFAKKSKYSMSSVGASKEEQLPKVSFARLVKEGDDGNELKEMEDVEVSMIQQELNGLKECCEKLSLIEDEYKNLKNESEELKELLKDYSPDSKLSSAVYTLLEENEMLKVKIKELKANMEELQLHKERSQVLQEVVQKQSAKLDSLSNADAEIRSKSGQLEDMEKEMEEQKDRIESTECELKDKICECEDLKAERDMLRLRLADTAVVSEDIEKLKFKAKEADACRTEKESLCKRVEELERELKEFECRTMDYENLLRERKAYVGSMNDFAELQLEVEALRIAALEMDALKRQVQECECVIQDQEDEIQRLLEQIDWLTKKRAKQQNRMKEALCEMRDEMEKKNSLMMMSDERLEQVQHCLRSTIGDVQRQKQCLCEEIESLNVEVNKYKQLLMEKQQEIDYLYDHLEAKNTVIGELSSDRMDRVRFENDFKESLHICRTLEKQLVCAKNENEELQRYVKCTGPCGGDEHVDDLLLYSKKTAQKLCESICNIPELDAPSSNEQLQQELNEAKKLVQQLKAELESVKTKCMQTEQSAKRDKEESMMLLDRVSAKVSSKESECNEKLNEMRKQVEKLKNELENERNLRKMGDSNNTCSAKGDIGSAPSALNELQKVNNDLEKEIALLRAEIESLRKQVGGGDQADLILSLQKENATLKMERDEMEKQIKLLSKDIQDLGDSGLGRKEKTDGVKEVTKELPEDLKTTKYDARTAGPVTDSSKDLNDIINSLRQENDKLIRENIEVDVLKTENADLRAELQRLKGDPNVKSSAAGDTAQLQSEIDRLKSELDNLKRENESLKSTAKGIEPDQPKQVLDQVSKDKEVVKDDKELEDLKNQLTKLRSDLDKANVENEKLKKESDDKSKELETIKNASDNAELFKQIEKLKGDLDKATADNEKLKKEGADVKQDSADVKKDGADVKKDGADVKKDDADVKKDADAAKVDGSDGNAVLLKQIDAVKDDLDKALQDKDAALKDINRLKSENDELRKMLTDLQEKTGVAVEMPTIAEVAEPVSEPDDAELKRLREENAALRRENDALRNQLAAPGEGGQALVDEVEKLDDQVKGLFGPIPPPSSERPTSDDAQALKDELAQLKEQLEKERNECEKKLKALKMKSDIDLKNIHNKYNDGVAKLQKSHEEILADVTKDHESQIEGLRDRCMCLEAEKKKLEKANERPRCACDNTFAQTDRTPLTSKTIDNMVSIRPVPTSMKYRQRPLSGNTFHNADIPGSTPCKCGDRYTPLTPNELEHFGVAPPARTDNEDIAPILRKILQHGIEALLFDELSQLHNVTCNATADLIAKTGSNMQLLHPHETDKLTLMRRIANLEEDLSKKQRIAKLKVNALQRAVKMEKERLEDIKKTLPMGRQRSITAASGSAMTHYTGAEPRIQDLMNVIERERAKVKELEEALQKERQANELLGLDPADNAINIHVDTPISGNKTLCIKVDQKDRRRSNSPPTRPESVKGSETGMVKEILPADSGRHQYSSQFQVRQSFPLNKNV